MPKHIIPATGENFLDREGLTRTVALWEDALRIDTRRGTFEWWYFDAHFGDQSTVVIVFATKPLLERSGPLKPNIALTITHPDGTKLAYYPIFLADQFSASKEKCDVRIGPNWARGEPSTSSGQRLHRYEVHAEMNGVSVDLTFTGIVPPWRPGAGKVFFDGFDHYFAWLPSIPYGTVEGTLTYDSQTHKVKGTGYHDHNWGNVGLNNVMDHWYWGRAHIGNYTLIYVEQIASKAYGFTRIPVFMLAKDNEILVGNGESLTMQARDFISHESGRAYPRQVDFNWNNGNESVRLHLRQPKIIEATSLLLLLPKWQQWIARLFSNPYYFRFNAELELEINLKNVKAKERGPALYEIMILQGKKHP